MKANQNKNTRKTHLKCWLASISFFQNQICENESKIKIPVDHFNGLLQRGWLDEPVVDEEEEVEIFAVEIDVWNEAVRAELQSTVILFLQLDQL